MVAKNLSMPITGTADGYHTLFSSCYNQTYHSVHGARVEAEHVFFRGAGVEKRCAQSLPTHILEVGFGAGLNFLLTTQRAIATSTPLHYTALERDLLSADCLAQLNHGTALQCETLAQTMIAWIRSLPEPLPTGTYSRAFSPECTLQLVLGDATLHPIPTPGYDAVYLDAFSPDANPELWTPSFLAQLFARTNPHGKIATYTAKGSIRRRLMACGYRVIRQSGPPGKREMLVGIRDVA